MKTNSKGTIPLCPHKGCGFKCCDFQQTNSIFMYPGEIEQARAQGKSMAHLQVLDSDYHGGVRVRCWAKDTGTCDGGYKPLDCASYPFFPAPARAANGHNGGDLVMLTKDPECPIRSFEIPLHQRFVRGLWQRLFERDASALAWARAIPPEDRYEPIEDAVRESAEARSPQPDAAIGGSAD